MIPTKQAISTEVEGETTVEITGNTDAGESLKDLQQQDLDNQTTDTQGEEPKQAEPKGEDGVLSKGQEVPEQIRYERRTEKLIDKLKEKTDVESALRRQLEEGRQVPQQEEQQLPPWLMPQMPDEVTPEEYRANVAESARKLVQVEMRAFQNEFIKIENFRNDLIESEAKYPILDPKSEYYDKVKSDKIAELYEKASAGDPNLRLSKFVDSIMSFHEAGQNSGREEIKASVIKQEAEAAVTPNQTSGESNHNSDDWESITLKQKEQWMKDNGIWN